MVNKVDTVLNAWYLLESIQPKELPKSGEALKGNLFMHQEDVPRLMPVELSAKPWEKYMLKDTEKNSIQFQYYMNCYEQWQLTEKLRSLFNSNEELHVKDTSKKYSYTFSVDAEGKYIEGTLFIPFVHYLLKALGNGENYGKVLEQYEVICRQMEREVVAVFTNGVSSEKILELQHRYLQNFGKPFEEPSKTRTHKWHVTVSL